MQEGVLASAPYAPLTAFSSGAETYYFKFQGGRAYIEGGCPPVSNQQGHMSLYPTAPHASGHLCGIIKVFFLKFLVF